MIIDIQKGRDNNWWVTAHTPSGLAHDSFATQAAAVDFAQAFYGGQLVTMGQAA